MTKKGLSKLIDELASKADEQALADELSCLVAGALFGNLSASSEDELATMYHTSAIVIHNTVVSCPDDLSTEDKLDSVSVDASVLEDQSMGEKDFPGPPPCMSLLILSMCSWRLSATGRSKNAAPPGFDC